MPTSNPNERRQDAHRGSGPARPPLLQVRPLVAALLLGLAVALTALADFLSPPQIWLGPVYLLFCAMAAWFVGSRFAIALGVVIIAAKLLSGHEGMYPYGVSAILQNFALRFLCVLVVVLMLRLARRSLETEWRLARTDPLTGALNRQAFFEAMAADTERRGPTLLVYADVDGLKRLNDQFGHELGDEALRDFSNRTRGAVRKNDLFARMGGDEFALFMKVRDLTAARTVAQRLDKVLNQETAADAAQLKCSLGVVFLPMGSKSIDAELRLADTLMYAAKRAGTRISAALAVEVEGQRMVSSPLAIDSHDGRRTSERSQTHETMQSAELSIEALATGNSRRRNRSRIAATG